MTILWKSPARERVTPKNLDEMYDGIPMQYKTYTQLVEEKVEGFYCDNCGAIEPEYNWNCTIANNKHISYRCIHCETVYYVGGW